MPSSPTLAEGIPELTEAWKAAVRSGSLPDDWDMAPFIEAGVKGYNEETPPRLRLSYGKDCDRCQWFAHNSPGLARPRGTERVGHLMGSIWEGAALGHLAYVCSIHPDFEFRPEWMQKELVCPDFPDIKGHPDGAIYWRGEPWAIVDPKFTKSFAHRWWFPRLEKHQEPDHLHGRIPPETWGYRHQAGNYLAASGLPWRGFIWMVGFRDSEQLALGWADADEVLPYHEYAKETYARAMRPDIPPPIHENREESPCMNWINKSKGIKKVYCEFYTHCIQV